jgi:hypothetical protein
VRERRVKKEIRERMKKAHAGLNFPQAASIRLARLVDTRYKVVGPPVASQQTT